MDHTLLGNRFEEWSLKIVAQLKLLSAPAQVWEDRPPRRCAEQSLFAETAESQVAGSVLDTKDAQKVKIHGHNLMVGQNSSQRFARQLEA
jgi:hypothetical protein